MKIFSRKENKKIRLSTRQGQMGIHPERDWWIILAVFASLNLVAVGFHAYLFYEISRGGFFVTPEAPPVEINSVDRDRLNSALEMFTDKEGRLIKKVTTPEEVPSVR